MKSEWLQTEIEWFQSHLNDEKYDNVVAMVLSYDWKKLNKSKLCQTGTYSHIGVATIVMCR